jgi:hypothetical protein
MEKITLEKISLFYHSRQKIDRNYEEKPSPTENLLVYLTGRINGKILAEFER